MRLKLTCVTATFNVISSGNRESLIRCVESVAKLGTDHEHLIFDGASKDGTVELLLELERRTPGLRVVSEPDKGIYNALNKGLRNARGEWFYVLGADDYIVDTEYFDAVLDNPKETTSVIVGPVLRNDGKLLFEKESDLSKIFFGYPYSHQGVVMKTDIVRKYGGFDERYLTCADWNLFFACHKAGEIHEYLFKPFTYYAEGGFSEDPSNVESIRDGFHAIRKKALGLSDREYERYWRRRFPSIGKIMWLLRHRDLAFRLSGRRMISNLVHFWLRMLFYPVVVLRRQVIAVSKRRRTVDA